MAEQYIFRNPGINGIAAMDVTLPLPGEGEIFTLGGGMQFGVRQGQQVKVLDNIRAIQEHVRQQGGNPDLLFPQSGTPEQLLAAERERAKFGLGTTAGAASAFVGGLLQKQGIDISKLQDIAITPLDRPFTSGQFQYLQGGANLADFAGRQATTQTFAPFESNLGAGAKTFTELPPAAAQAVAPQAVAQPTLQNLPFRGDLTPQQVEGIQKLVASTPATSFTEQDVNNFAYATGTQFRKDLTPPQKQSIVNLMTKKSINEWTDTDKTNWRFATNNAPLPGAVQATKGELIANKEFVNAAFRTFYGRDAKKDELDKYTGQTVDSIRNALMAGASPQDIQKKISSITSPEPLSAEIPETISTDLLSKNITNNDIQKLITEQDDTRKKLLAAMSPTAAETNVQNQLSTLRGNINQVLASYEQGVVNINGQPIPMPLLRGQAQALQEQTGVVLSNLQRQEANLLQSLGLEQDARGITLDALKTKQSFIKDDINLQFQIQDRIQAQKDRIEEQKQQMRKESRDQLELMVGMLGGLAFDDLDVQTQGEVSRLATENGIPISVLSNALKNAKDEMMNKKIMDDLKISQTQSDIDVNRTKEAIEAQKQMNLQNSLDNGILTEDQVKQTQPIYTQVKTNPAYTGMIDVYNGYLGVQASQGQETGAGDIALINSFQRLVDPGATVREGDVSVIRSAQGIVSRFLNADGGISDYYLEKAKSGRILTGEAVKDMVKVADDLYSRRLSGYNEIISPQRNLAENQGIDFETYISKEFPSIARTKSVTINKSYFDVKDLVRENPDVLPQVIEMKRDNIPDKDILRMYSPDFNNDLSKSQNYSVKDIAESIAIVESSGNYSALGPIIKSGTYSGQRAMGKYQIMQGNIPAWSQEILGRRRTAEEFLRNPELQDLIAVGKMNKIFDKYKTPQDVASVWFSGRPFKEATS